MSELARKFGTWELTDALYISYRVCLDEDPEPPAKCPAQDPDRFESTDSSGTAGQYAERSERWRHKFNPVDDRNATAESSMPSSMKTSTDINVDLRP